jgi:hypothetical protein
MNEMPDFMKDIGEIVEKLTPDWEAKAPAEEGGDCEQADCPLHISKDGFRNWLSSYLANPDINRTSPEGKTFVVGLAMSDKNPIVRYLKYLCPSDVGELKISTLGSKLVLGRQKSDSDRMQTEAYTHPLTTWAVEYIGKLKSRFRAGESIDVSDAIELLD